MMSERGVRWLLGVVIVLLVIFFVILGFSLWGRDEGRLRESEWLGKLGPSFEVENLYEGKDLVRFGGGEDLVLLNFFASWCVPCRAEHELLGEIDISVTGIAWKDKRLDAQKFLEETGNPYDFVGFDEEGRVSVLWGILGIPESYIVDREGIVRYHKVGPITPTLLEEEIEPLIERLKAEG